ncbi:DNA primase family protein [Deinococcus aestuarii]|uniref:DNA primase family protein n=1 Tax=Deinococcus aestuarii TaxID=2774531 RepID=UPI001C0AAB20|nr:phage/plasmid primase, P4 family [Deinococcus aestuarii]
MSGSHVETVETFARFFPPNPVKHGRVLGRDPQTGKKKVETKEGAPVTLQALDTHLGAKGKVAGNALGYLPGYEDGTLVGAIDLDGKDFPGKGLDDARRAVLETCAGLNLNAYPERSRSGKGWHIWLWADERLPYGVMRAALREIAHHAELPKVETYPMGDDARGRWIITPYSRALKGERPYLGRTYLETDEGQPIPVDELGEWITPNPAERLCALAQEHAERARPTMPAAAPAAGSSGDLLPEAVPLLLEAAREHAPAARHDALAAFLNMGQRAGDLAGMVEGLKTPEVFTRWCADGSRTVQEWAEEVDRWAENVETGGAEARRGLPYLREVGFTVPDLPRRKDAERVEKLAGGMNLGELPQAADIPEAEHWVAEDRAEYSDRQMLDLLGLNRWPVTAPDTDTAHAYRLAELAGGDLRYTGKLGGWLAFDGRQWRMGAGRKGDGEGDLMAQGLSQKLSGIMGPEVARLFALRGVLAPFKGSREMDIQAMERAAWRHVRAQKAVESRSKQKAVLENARPLLMVDHALFEPRPWVLGFQNGVWDHGQMREHRREDHMLTLSPVEYHADADRGVWQEVLDRITGGDAELARTLQDVAGYVLSGSSTLRLLPWLYGPKGTGKSTFAELLGTVLGDMAASLDTKLFAADSARERLGAAVWGKRAAFCAEAGNARLDAELLKTLSGGDRLPVRFLFSEPFTAAPRHVLLMVANDAPRVEAYDEALKDRVLALPFLHPLEVPGLPRLLGGARIEAMRQDPTSALVQGFTPWAVEGLGRVLRERNVYRAPVTADATAGFWADVDPLREFWASRDLSSLSLGVGTAEFRQEYEKWCEAEGARPVGQRAWYAACAAVGLHKGSNGKNRVWRLKTARLFPGWGSAGAGGDFDTLTLSGSIPNSSRESPPLKNDSLEELGTGVKSVKVSSAAGWEDEL